MNELLDTIDGIVWGPAMLVLILGTGLYLQIRLRGMPIRMIGSGLRMIWKGRESDAGHGEVSPFSALMTCLAATIGVGNVVGVATAIALGGPGAVFWMWVTALVGMATKYAEVVVAVQFRERDEDGRFVGGPMYAIRNGMAGHWKWLGTTFAVFGGLAGFGIGNMVQANSIADAVQDAFGIGNTLTGIVLVVITGAVVLGGLKRIAAIANWLVPFMAIAYVAGGLVVLATHAVEIPGAFVMIVSTAFTGTAATGGFVGAAMITAIRFGVARGVFSNEAGLGTAGIVQAAGASNNVIKSGLIGMMGTFIDTIVVCTITGLAIVITGAWTSGTSGAALTQLAFNSAMPGFGNAYVAIVLTVFALTTIFGWAYYGERCWQFLFGKKIILPYRLLWTIAVMMGATIQMETVWIIADILNALMAIPNLVSLLVLAPVIVQLTDTQLRKVIEGTSPRAALEGEEMQGEQAQGKQI
ncbi:MAG: sodium:alanine symporter family protein [Pseudomonadota bacterium]|nr:sodium:alanine symporter family protein [Pseudomonadota bacterium]